MKFRIVFAMVFLVLTVGSTYVMGQEYYCFNCIVWDECFYCLMFEPSGGLSCYTPSCTSCILEGICPAGGGGCFLKGTMVQMRDGCKAIEELEIGDQVLGLNDLDEPEYRRVTETYKSINCGYYLINGELRVTGTHPFMVNGEWMPASAIEVGDKLMDADLKPVVVESVDVVKKVIRAYNIKVAGIHTFFVEGVLVHNKGKDPFEP